VAQFTRSATRAPNNLSSSQPTPMRPRSRVPARMDEQERGVARSDAAIGEQSGQVRNGAAHAGGTDEEKRDDNPKSERAKAATSKRDAMI
jgi:hypothetical protein